ncbi:MAG: hypothetical protein ACT4N4_01625 [Rhodospirillales bacterium]
MKHVLWGGALAVLALGAGDAAAAMLPEDISKKLTQQFAVKVLRIEPGEFDGRKVFIVRVMGAPGNSNSAFEVSTLAIDPDTGNPISAFRHTKSGYELSGHEATLTNRNNWGVPDTGRPWR